MKNKLCMLAVAVSLASVSTVSFAQESAFEKRVDSAKHSTFSYRWVELDYVTWGSNEFGKDDFDGFRVDVSVPVADQISVIGDLTAYSNKFVDTTKLSGGASYNLNIGSLSGVAALDKMDGVIHAEIEYYDTNKGVGSETGIYTGVEARYWALEGLEVYADLSIRTAYDTDLVIASGVRWAVIDALQLTAGFTLADADELYLGARYNF